MDDKSKRQRLQRIQPYLPALSNNKEPEVKNKAQLVTLLHDLKDEGNCLFREAKYKDAWQMYLYSLFVARQLERTFYHNVDKIFMGTLFCNAALCSLKTDDYAEALKSANMALHCDPKNIKAMYRKTVALKELGRHKEALETAQAGYSIDSKNFSELVDELTKIANKSKKSKASASVGKASAPTATESSSNEWLVGANAHVDKEIKGSTPKKMPKKKKEECTGNSNAEPAPAAINRNQNNHTSQAPVDESSDPSDSDSDSSDADDGFSDQAFAARLSSLQQNQSVPPVNKKKAPAKLDTVNNVKPAAKNVSGVKSSMGLDDISVANANNGNNTKLKTKQPTTKLQNATKSLPPTNLVWPLADKFDFCLTCQICFIKESEGVGGYRFKENLQHSCHHDTLLVKAKGNPNWLKVRPRLVRDGVPHLFKYKMCIQFQQKQPCRIGEVNCSFAHNHMEVQLWTKDKDEEFNIAEFINEARAEGIYTSQIYDQRVKGRVRSTSLNNNIPGLNYVEKETRKNPSPAPQSSQPGPVPVINTSIPPPKPQTTTQQTQPQYKPFVEQRAAHTNGLPVQPPTKGSSIHATLNNVPVGQLPNMNQPPPDHPCPRIPNPFPGYNFRLCCPICLHLLDVGAWKYTLSDSKHNCGQFMLAFHVPEEYNRNVWLRVRDRSSHRNFMGYYILCHSATHQSNVLCERKENCSFAHNKLEQSIWKMEQEGKFDIGAFIIQNRKASQTNLGFLSHVTEVGFLLEKFGGYFRWICRECFFSPRPMISSLGANNGCSNQGHLWERFKIIAHVLGSTVTPIDERKNLQESAYYTRCNFLHFCQRWFSNSCWFAHSDVERYVWMVERDTKITREDIVRISIDLHHGNNGAAPNYASVGRPKVEAPASSTAPQIQAAPVSRNPPSYASIGASTHSKPVIAQNATTNPVSPPSQQLLVPPVNLSQLCRTCWGNGQRCCEDANKDKCVKNHSNFKLNSVFVALPAGKEVRSVPPIFHPNMKLVLCDFMPNCKRPVCNHPHNDEELQIWSWMLRNNVKQLRDVCEKIKQHQKSKTRKITEGESVVSVGSAPKVTTQTKTVNQIIAPGDLYINEHYCHYCGTSYNSVRQWDDHCMTEKHLNNVNSDKEHQWNYRQPPWGQGNNLAICEEHRYDKSCRYSYVPDMYNLCKYAHSEKELDEWRERQQWRKMKRDVAKERHMFSYTDALLEDFYKNDSSVNVISEYLLGVDISCKEELVLYRSEKNATHTWVFEVRAEGDKELDKVALLYNKDRLHFSLKCTDNTQHQVAAGDLFLDVRGGAAVYKIEVQFSGGMFGSFSQWVVFDFGQRPVLVKKLAVEIGDQNQDIEKVKELRDNLSANRWSSQNRQIVRVPRRDDKFTEEQLIKYKEPTQSSSVVTVDSMAELNQHNYAHKMHKMLELEEITRLNLLSNYNLITSVVLTPTIEEPGQFIISRDGDLFMKVKLSEYLTEDTLAGKLVLSTVSSVLFAPVNSVSQKVYEAVILKDSNYNYDGRGKDYIYIVVSAPIVKDLNLVPNKQTEIEIQFQMDRKLFCRMHYAIDNLTNMDVVFPDVMKFKPQLDQVTSQVKSNVLNEDQMTAVRHIVLAPEGYKPPFIMYGPFGTGKTETLAQATMAVLKNKSDYQKTKCDAHILICTQSNSAADLYISKHFGTYFKKNSHLKMLRLMYEDRRPETVPKDVLDFCLINTQTGSFLTPPIAVIKGYNLILVTVENSMQLARMKLYDYFSHIFIDEAGQSLECETLMPLTLASTRTCVVLTGDHNQIGPIVYSQEARKQTFDVSVLVRLYNYYEQIANCGISQVTERSKRSPLNILLSINYRTKPEILRFISSVFYGGPENLKAYGKIPSVAGITPLMFYAVQGKEIQNEDSTSYVNSAEAQEVIEQLQQLIENWPEEWGRLVPEVAAKQVAVISTYPDQIQYMRHTLRRVRGKTYLRNVYVGSIHGIQGQEFRAIYLSTVRSTHLLQEPHLIKALEAGDDIGDLGFLSNPKLINTALTRAQSFVAVVGDPVALCLIGECIQEWRTYLKHCSNMGSVRPQSYTYELVRNQVIQIQMGPAGKIIDLIAKRSQENFKQVIRRKNQKAEDKSLSDTSELNSSYSYEESPPKAGIRSKVEPAVYSPGDSPLSVKSSVIPKGPTNFVRQFSQEDLSLSSSTSCECILQCLAKESAKLLETPKLEDVQIEEKDGFIVVQCTASSGTPPFLDQYKKGSPNKSVFRVIPESEDFVAFTVDTENQGAAQTFDNFGPEKLNAALMSGRKECLRCSLHSEGERIYATVLPPLPGHSIPSGFTVGSDVEIPGPLYCGHAFIGDTVLVQLIGQTDQGMQFGLVKGILQRLITPEGKLFICTADPSNCNVLSPLNTALPLFYSITSSPRLKLARKGNLCVYKFDHSSGLEFSHYERVTSGPPDRQMFVVRYLCWQPGFKLPFGVVVGVINVTSTLEKGMQVLEAEYNISRTLGSAAQAEADELFPPDFSVPQHMFKDRQDLTSLYSFSMGEESSEEIEMAISVTQDENFYQIGLHVVDVVAFVNKNSPLDQECAHRGASFFPLGKEPKHMFPTQVCTDFCSLKPDFDRLAVSVVISVDENGAVLGLPDIFRSVVQSKQHFSHSKVQEILMNPAENETSYLNSCIQALYQLTYVWRYERLGNGYLSHSLTAGEQLAQHAHLMMEEVKIKFNSIVAEVLLSTFEQATPLLVDGGPVSNKLELWRKENACHALNSIPMARAFRDDQVCRCTKTCTCVFSYIRRNRLQGPDYLAFLKDTWHMVSQSVSEDISNFEHAQDLISRVDNKPEVATAAGKLARIKQSERFLSSNQVAPQDRKHYSLSTGPYTNFTNPLQRYISIIVQRLLVAYSAGSASPYSSSEMELICVQATSTEQQVARFNQEAFQLHLSAALEVHPIVMNCLIQKLDRQKAVLSLPGVDNIQEVHSSLHLADLAPRNMKLLNEKQALLQWERRVYNSSDFQNSRAPLGTVDINTNRLMYNIPTLQWQKLMGATRERNEEEIAAYVEEISKLVVEEREDILDYPEVRSGISKDGQVRHYVPFTFALQEGQPLTVQLSAEVREGLLRPSIQLLSITPLLEICLEHQRNAVSCFLGSSTEDLPQGCSSNETLQKVFPMLRSVTEESAKHAITSGERITIHSVLIAWRSEFTNGTPVIVGEFILSDDFCNVSCFQPDLGSRAAAAFVNGQRLFSEDQNFCLDFLCVRYAQIDVPDEPVLEESVSAVVNTGLPVTWVGHCRVVDVSKFGHGLVVKVALVQSSMNMPKMLLTDNGITVPSTIEWIRKTQVDRIMDISLRSLHLASTFAQEVFLGKKPTNLIDPLPQDNSVLKSSLSEDQEDMISTAFQQPFTAVTGGPGTGKSLCAARLAHLFIQRNRTADGMRQAGPESRISQLMICSATELSLDVITGLLKVLNRAKARIVRVYDEEIEEEDFPTSTEIRPTEFTNSLPSVVVQEDIALHHLIRKAENPDSQALLEQEMVLTMSGSSVDPLFKQQFQACLDRAQSHELQKANVILCTCATSARRILRLTTCVKQIIIDDAGVIPEGLSLVPLVAHREVNQLVLFGDTQMPSGKMHDIPAHSNTSRSMVSRFSSQGIVLTEQFRTASALCSFPSIQFYQGLMVTSSEPLNLPPAISIPWPGEVGFPSVFCHIEGTESITNSNYTNEDSVVNVNEAVFVNKLVSALIHHHGIKESSITILAMTRAQSEHIKKTKTHNVDVATVLDSLGRESEYVILSCVRSLASSQLHQPRTMDWSKQHFGRVADSCVLNLAITRANVALFIVGNIHLLRTSEDWSALIKTYKEKQSLQYDANAFLDSLKC